MKLPAFLGYFLAASWGHCIEFDTKPLGVTEGARLEVVSIRLPADKADAILKEFDGSPSSASACFLRLNTEITDANAVGEMVFREAKAPGNWTFESTHEEEIGKAERLLSMRLAFYRDAKRDQVWAFGAVTPSYAFEVDGMGLKYAGETTLIGSDFTPGVVKLLGVVPCGSDRDERLDARVRVLFGKITATEEALALLEDHELGSPIIGVIATEVMLPLARYDAVGALGLNNREIVDAMRRQQGARVLSVYAGETVHNGRIRQRAAWGNDLPLHPNSGHGCLFDCDPAAVDGLKLEEEDRFRPPAEATGVVMFWYEWQRVLAGPKATVTKTFHWNEGWDNPGHRVVEQPGPVISGGGGLSLWLPDGTAKIAAVSILGDPGTEDRQVIVLCVRANLRPL